MKKISPADIVIFRQWFNDYTATFNTTNDEDQKNITLKTVHSNEVCRNALQIAGEILNGSNILLVEAAALFHDIGRFQQYARFKTFDDAASINHGKLGAEILEQEQVLGGLSRNEQDIIVQAVRFHNAFSIPDLNNPLTIQIIKLVRDADKLDIWCVFIDYFQQRSEERASAAGVGLPDSPGYSGEVLALLFDKKVVPLVKATRLNDYKLVQLSWIFDLNITSSFRILKERGIIERLSMTLPQTDDIRRAVRSLNDHVYRRICREHF